MRDHDLEAWEEDLRRRVAALPADQKAAYHRRFGDGYKDPDTYAALNWALLAGFHHYYLGSWIRGTVNLGVSLTGIVLAVTGSPIGYLLIAVVFLIELPALFRAQKVCRRHNLKRGERILSEISQSSTV